MSVQPAPAPTGQPATTMHAALFGDIRPHPWWDAHFSASDAYSLFHSRSSAMGWLDDSGNSYGGLWGMNDAASFEADRHQTDSDQATDPNSPPRCIAWFQVTPRPVPADRPQPVQPFLACADDVVRRIGVRRLRAVQVLVPARQPTTTGTAPPLGALRALQPDAGWFADPDPGDNPTVSVTVDGGQDPAIHTAAPQMLDWLDKMQETVSCDSFSSGEDGLLLLPLHDGIWQGPARHRATFPVRLPEWSMDAIGWVSVLLAEAGSQCGAGGPLVLTVSRSDG